MLSFRIRPVIKHVRNTEGRPFLSFFIRHVRNTDVGPFLMLRFGVLPFIRHVRNTEGGTFLSFSLDMLEIQNWDHFLCYVSRSALVILDMF